MKLRNILFNVVVILVVLFAAFVGFLRFGNTLEYAVESPSMAPTLREGDLILVRSCGFDDLQVGDVVTVRYYDNTGVFTHRVTKLDAAQRLIYTKGDANQSEDPQPAVERQLIGKLWFSLPLLGWISLRFSQRTVLLTLAAAVIVVIVIREGIVFYQKKKRRAAPHRGEEGSK